MGKITVRLTSLDNAIGLESDHVIIMGLGHYYHSEQAKGLTIGERRLAMMENTRHVLRGVSRAKKSVSMYYINTAFPTNFIPPEFRSST